MSKPLFDITALRRIVKPTDPNRLRRLKPGEVYIHDHTNKRTSFATWIAVNRRRTGINFRCTDKDISGVLPMLIADRSKLKAGYYARKSRSGRYHYFKVQAGLVERVRPDAMPRLPEGMYTIWID
jgi:hypothetical protein